MNVVIRPLVLVHHSKDGVVDAQIVIGFDLQGAEVGLLAGTVIWRNLQEKPSPPASARVRARIFDS